MTTSQGDKVAYLSADDIHAYVQSLLDVFRRADHLHHQPVFPLFLPGTKEDIRSYTIFPPCAISPQRA